MQVDFHRLKRCPFSGSSANRGTYRRYFDERANIEALEREIAARIEADHERSGWW